MIMQNRARTLSAILFVWMHATAAAREATAVKEMQFAGPHDMTIKLRMEGPYTADVPLQIVCYFKYTKEGAARMSGAPVELDKELSGVIAALRERGEFVGNEMETLLLMPPPGSIKARALLLVGVGDESKISLATMECVGQLALRESARLGTTKVAFAPLLRDQGNSTLPAGDVEQAVTRGLLLAYDTQKRLESEGLAKPFTLSEWIVEAGPKYYDETAAGITSGIKDAAKAASSRPATRYAATK
jgi:hypothetical protein